MSKGKTETLDRSGARGTDLLGMSARSRATGNGLEGHSVTGVDRTVAKRVLAEAGNPPIAVVLWNGEEIGPDADPVARLLFRDRGSLYGLIWKTDLHFGDAYSHGRIEVEGDLVAALEAIYRGVHRAIAPNSWKRRFSAWLNHPNPNSQSTARGNIHHHYDLGNDFYRLWLDERMVYTCAYYPSAGATLENAQIAKMEYVCRKLQLEPGLEVVEAGCGWGALALHMAKEHGVSVRAYNISHQQIVYARARAEAEGLTHLVEFIEDDYRTIDRTFDRFVSVGMLEHVGTHNYRGLGKLLTRCLKPDGRGLIHSIGRNAPAANNPWIEQRIFPGSRPPSLTEMAGIFEAGPLAVLDVENLRLHYARTCRDWLDRFEAKRERVREIYDESFVRAWRLYLAGSTAAFRTGSLQLFQVVFAHEEDNAIPLTRNRLYE